MSKIPAPTTPAPTTPAHLSMIPAGPPTASAPRPFLFPEPVRAQAPWGGEIAAARVSTVPVVHARFAFRTGAVALAVRPPAPGLDGAALSRLITPVLRHGIGPWDAPGLAAHLDRMGARFSLALGQDQSALSASGFAHDLDKLLALLRTAMTEASAGDKAMEREREKSLQYLHHQLADPGAIAGAWMGRALYGHHPYSGPMATEPGLQSITGDHIDHAWAALCAPRDSLLLIVGDVDPHEAIDKALACFAGIPVPPRAPVLPAAPPPPAPTTVGVLRPGSEQLTVQVGVRMFERTHPDWLPMRIAHQILGAGASSRLFLRLREAQGLTYDAWSQLDGALLGGDLTCGLAAATDRARAALDALNAELKAFVDDPPSQLELEAAQRNVVGSFPGKASGVGGVARLLSVAWMYGLPTDHWARYPATVSALTRDALVTAIRKHVHPDGFSTVIIGPQAAVDAALEDHPQALKVPLQAPPLP